MAKSSGQKQKILILQQILLEKTDENHPMKMSQLIAELEKEGIQAERKALYHDLQVLEDAGLDVNQSREGYYVQQRLFEDAELAMLMDAVAAARFITPKKTRSLVQKLTTLTSSYRAKELLGRTVLGVRPKSENESILYTTEDLTGALWEGQQISFDYLHWSYDPKGTQHFVREKGRGGQRYQVSPKAVVWDDENEYLIGYDHQKEELRHFRLDRMVDVLRLDLPAQKEPDGQPFDAKGYCGKHFGMFGGQEETVRLRFPGKLAGAALDYFGQNSFAVPDGEEHFVLTAQVVVSPRFFSWIFGFSGEVQLVSPPSVVEQLKEALNQPYIIEK